MFSAMVAEMSYVIPYFHILYILLGLIVRDK